MAEAFSCDLQYTMAVLTDSQYANLKGVFSALISGNGYQPNPRALDADLRAFFSRFSSDFNSASPLTINASAAIGRSLQSVLANSGYGLRSPEQAALRLFFQYLAVESYSSPPISDGQYSAMRELLRAALSDNDAFVGLPDAALLSYFGSSMTTTPISGFTAIGVAQNSWWSDTGKFTPTGVDPNQYVARDRYARLSVITSDTSMTVEAVKPASAFIDGISVDVWVNRVYNQTIKYGGPVSTKQQIVISLPPGNKLVELYDFAAITGISVTGAVIIPGLPARSIAIFGASGSMAQYGWLPLDSPSNAGNPVWTVTWPALVRNSGRFDALYNASTGSFGTSSFGIGVGNQAPFMANFVAQRMKGTAENVVVLEMGAGDHNLNVSTPTNFAIMMGQTADTIHAAYPSAKVIIQSPIVYTAGDPNSLGFNMADYAVGLPAVCAARSPWCVYADGMQMASNPSDLFDNLHVFPTKQRYIADYYLSLVG